MHIEKLFHPWRLAEERKIIMKWRLCSGADECLRNNRRHESGGTKILFTGQVHFCKRI